jgi:hypothetical protein
VADEGGKFNPASLYVGVVELFAILLPGAILTFLLYESPFFPTLFKLDELKRPFLPSNPAIRSVGFALVSYVAGHFLAALGYFVMNPLFEDYYASPLAKHLRTLTTRAKGTLDGIVKLESDRHDEQFRWTIAYVSLYSPQASTHLDRLEADCKFFRNLTPTILLSFPLIDSAYWSGCRVSPMATWVPVFLIAAFFLTQALWNKKFSSNLGKSLLLLFLLWVALIFTSLRLCGPTESLVFVNLGICGLMLLAGIRYIALQEKLVSTVYELLVVLFCKRPEVAIAPESADKP